jgi:S-DNA-T family DNA segregation ATPase FtsK/SpoIIIE
VGWQPRSRRMVCAHVATTRQPTSSKTPAGTAPAKSRSRSAKGDPPAGGSTASASAKKPPAKRRTPAKTGASKGGSKASTRTSSTRATTRTPKAAPVPAGPGPLQQAFEGHGHDVGGIVLILVGIVMGLGLYGDLAGPVGRGLAQAAGAGVGKAAYLVPPALVLLGALWMRGPRTDEDGLEIDDPARSVRPVVGSLLLLVAAVGLLHLTGGRPPFGSPLQSFIDAGGYLGAAIGVPLEKVIAVWGAALVCVAIGVIGIVILTDTSLRVAAGRTVDGVRPVRHGLGKVVGSLFELRDGNDLDDDPDVLPEALDLRDKKAALGADGTPTVFVAGEDDAPSNGAPAAEAEVSSEQAKPKRAKKAEPLHVPSEDEVPADTEQLDLDLGPAAKGSNWKLPSPKLLARSEVQQIDAARVEELGHTLEAALAAHGVETRLVGMVVGPTVTRYELELGPGVKVARVTSLHKDIAYAMASPDVRILAPIPGRQAIGVEVPNEDRQIVAVGDILTSEEARKATHPLEVAIGRDINGRSVLANLATMPHVLIAGATGAGKSSCINSLITSILMRSTPDQVRMILIDPKRVELGQYNKLPHLLTQVVTNPKKAANALNWAVKEMERRYDLLAEVGFRDINGYNAAFDRGDLKTDETDAELGLPVTTYERLPYIIIVVDELNDLMMVAARDVEEAICRIAQMARAVGLHLVIATQRPSVNVITGVIKANVPARLAFAVSSLADSRVILDQPGAERLVGKGDLLLLGPSSSIAQRIQGCWVSEKEVRAVVGAWLRQAPDVQYLEGVEGSDDGSDPSSGMGSGSGSSGDDDDDDLMYQAMELIVRSQLGSTSMLQRKLRVGFARAGRLMDLLEQRGVVGPSEGSKARAVLMTPEELDEALANR